MRFYPFGSSSLNQVYNTTLAITASISSYALTASYGLRVVTASYALSGSPGVDGTDGTCSYTPGPDGLRGPTGFTGTRGGVSIAQPSGST